MEKGYHKGQELTMSELGLSLEELAGQPLELQNKSSTNSGKRRCCLAGETA